MRSRDAQYMDEKNRIDAAAAQMRWI